jgi:hypothetical protein
MNYRDYLRKLAASAYQIDIEASMSEVAEALINHTVLKVNGKDYRIMEIEFYLHYPNHRDPFIHRGEGNPIQRTMNQWYVHRKGTDSFPFWKRNGLDLTVGTAAGAGGILFRRLELITTGDGPDGSGNVLNYLLKELDLSEASQLAQSCEGVDASDPGLPLFLEAKDTEKFNIYRAPRFNLKYNEAKREQKLPFIAKRYRFLANPHKTKHGRPMIYLSLLEQGIEPALALKVAKLNAKQAKESLDLYQAGLSTPPPLEMEDLKPETICKLMGSLSSFHKLK